jgi:hypothetical protein
MLAHLDETGEDQISPTDPDSRAMAAHTHVAVGYNVQVAVDVKHKLIVEQQVTNQVVDMSMLTQTAEPAKEVLGVDTIDVVADKGYFKIEDIEACEKAGLVPYVPRPQRGPSVNAGLFRKDEFSYDAESDSYTCPAAQRLQFPHGLAARERSGAGPDASAASEAPGGARPPARDGRASIQNDQAMDEPRYLPDAKAGEGPRGVQPDRARLQSAASAEHGRFR